MQDLAELAVDFALSWMKPDGSLLIKCFHGSGYGQLVKLFKDTFVSVAPRKPKLPVTGRRKPTFWAGVYASRPWTGGGKAFPVWQGRRIGQQWCWNQ
jgi:23S rRNA (uridine2552-2'-O)-methyltransferase